MGAVTGNAAFSYRLYRLEDGCIRGGRPVCPGCRPTSMPLFFWLCLGGTVVCFLAVGISVPVANAHDWYWYCIDIQEPGAGDILAGLRAPDDYPDEQHVLLSECYAWLGQGDAVRQPALFHARCFAAGSVERVLACRCVVAVRGTVHPGCGAIGLDLPADGTDKIVINNIN